MPEEPNGRLFLVDGYALIYRAFFAMMGRPLRTSRGENTSAVYGVAQFLVRLFERHHPTYLAWVHDAGTSFRHETYPGYKATREKLAPELQQDFDRSVERVREMLAAFRVPVIAVEGYEADDVIATLAAAASSCSVPAVIVSGDKDLYQLVGPSVSILNPGRGGPAAIEEQWIDPSNAIERLGVPPERVVDYLALVGDASDNIPGVRGIGDKTARQLIEQYGDLEAILAHAAEVPAKRVREALLAGVEKARLSRHLATVRRDVPVRLDLEALQVRPPDREALRKVLTELEFHELLERLDLLAASAPDVRWRRVTSVDEATTVARSLSQKGMVALRVHLAGADPLAAPLLGIALAGSDAEAWYLPLGHGDAGELSLEEPAASLPALTDAAMRPVRDLLADPAVPKAGHEIKNDWLALRRAGVELAGVAFDTLLASFVLDPGRRSHALELLAAEYVNLELREAGSVKARKRGSRVEAFAAPGAQTAARGALAVWQLRQRFQPQLEQLALQRLLEQIELPLIPVLVDMEWRGIAVDAGRLRELSRQFAEELGRLERAIYEEAGTRFNINSTAQLRHVLFEKLNLPVLKKTKTGPSTDASVLEELAALGFTVPALLLEYREVSKLKSTYADVLPQKIHPATGRIHTRFDQAGAATGRLSSLEPNLQNIPVRTARGELIRQCFVPGPGCCLIVADYSQIELRLLAHLSQDPAFVEAFRRGGDIHRETAAVIFGVPPEGVTPEMRARAKTINFATIYGQGPFALSRQLGISQEEAREFIRLYFDRFAGVRRFLDETVARARECGYVETLFGRRRYIPELNDPNFNVRALGERTAMNSPLQGSAADLIKVAMINLHRALRAAGSRSTLLLQVHDELVLEAPEDETDAVVEIVRREMEQAAALSVPLVVEIGVGANWLDAKR